MQAVEKFDPDRGIAFETFAPFRIRGAILDWLRDEEWISRLARARLNACLKAVKEMQEQEISNPSAEEIAKHLEVSMEEVTPVMKYLNGNETFMLHEAESDSDSRNSTNGFRFEFATAQDSQNSLQQIIDKETFDELVSCLSDLEQAIVILYYQSDLTFKEIGEMLGFSESRVCQIHEQIVVKLKDMFC
jgi:RNA polymerase sigma factor for flagellar operon FliA